MVLSDDVLYAIICKTEHTLEEMSVFIVHCMDAQKGMVLEPMDILDYAAEGQYANVAITFSSLLQEYRTVSKVVCFVCGLDISGDHSQCVIKGDS